MLKSLIAATTIATVACLPTAALLQAAETSVEISLKPVQAAVLKAGSGTAVAYFLATNGRCKVVVTEAGDPDTKQPGAMVGSRFETTISDGATTSTSALVGTDFQFKCAKGAQQLVINSGSQNFADASQ